MSHNYWPVLVGLVAATPRVAEAQTTTEAIVKQIHFCRVAAGFVKAPCAGKILGEEVLRLLAPLEMQNIRVSQTIIDLTKSEWKSKAVDWINSGLDWLGVPERYEVPKKIGYAFTMGVKLSDLSFAIPKDRTKPATFGGTTKLTFKVTSNGPFKGKTFNASGRAEGKLYVTVAPYGKKCKSKSVDWTMLVVNIELTKLDVDKIPDFIGDRKLFLALVNWGLSFAYTDFDEWKTRGIAICLTGKCPTGEDKADPTDSGSGPVVKFGGISVKNKYARATLNKRGGVKSLAIDRTLYCNLTNAIVNKGCTDNFVTRMAGLVLPISLPVPSQYGVPGLSVSADEFKARIIEPNMIHIDAKASVQKKGQSDKFTFALGATARIRPVCDASSFLLFVRPEVESASASAFPAWLKSDISRLAVNTKLPSYQTCFAAFKVPYVGQRLNICRITNAALKEKCTAPFVNALADAAFPLSVRPADLDEVKAIGFSKALKSIRLSVNKVKASIPAGKTTSPSVSVSVSLKKDGESAAFTASGSAKFGITLKCSDSANLIRVRPSITALSVSSLPTWLVSETLVTLANLTIARWHALCVDGDCAKKQKINLPFDALSTGTTAATAPKKSTKKSAPKSACPSSSEIVEVVQ